MDKYSSFPIPTTSSSHVGGITYGKIILFVYLTLFFGSALDAYNFTIVPIDWLFLERALEPVTRYTYNFTIVPIEWLFRVGLIAVFSFIVYIQRFYTIPGSRILHAFFLWALLVTMLNSIFNDYDSIMPALATTPYPIFISLRFINFLSFFAALGLVYWLLVNGYRKSIIKWTVTIGMFFALFAFYIYIAQMYGLPEPPRTRMSTGGNLDPNKLMRYTYAFHRATGTFREPSQLAGWLVIPFFLGIIYRKSLINIYSIVIGSVILLTGSLTAFIGVFLGIVVTMILSNPFRLKNIPSLFSALIAAVISLAIFNGIAVSNSEDKVDIMNVIADRLTPILFDGGLQQSSRSYIYQYVADSVFPLCGSGVGNANISFANYLNVSVIASFNSTYLDILYSTGLIGLAFVIYFLSVPVRRGWRLRECLKNNTNMWILCACYFSWLIMAAGQTDIFSLSFAIIFCLIVYELRQMRGVNR